MPVSLPARHQRLGLAAGHTGLGVTREAATEGKQRAALKSVCVGGGVIYRFERCSELRLRLTGGALVCLLKAVGSVLNTGKNKCVWWLAALAGRRRGEPDSKPGFCSPDGLKNSNKQRANDTADCWKQTGGKAYNIYYFQQVGG